MADGVGDKIVDWFRIFMTTGIVSMVIMFIIVQGVKGSLSKDIPTWLAWSFMGLMLIFTVSMLGVVWSY